MGFMKDILTEVEEMLELDYDYPKIVGFIREINPHYTVDDCMELIMDAETQLAIRYKDMEDYDIMDGDHSSALASAGWGTDEDYGGYAEDY